MLAPLLGLEALFCVASGRDCAPCQKWVKPWGFCSISKNDGRRVTFEEDLERCIFSGRHSTRDMFIRAVTRSGFFPGVSDRQVCWDDFAWQVQHFVWPGSGRRSAFDRWSGKIATRICTRPSALHSTFHFWRTSCKIALFLMLSTSKNEDVSQNCFVFDVVKFKNWGILADLCCQAQRLRKSRRRFIFKLADRQIERQLQLRLQLQVPLHYTILLQLL